MYLIILIPIICTLFFIYLSLKKIPKNYFLKKYFLVLNLIVLIWLLTNFAVLSTLSFFWFKMAYGTGAFILSATCVFILSFCEQKKMSFIKIAKIYFLGLLFFILSLFDNVFFLGKIDTYSNLFLIYVFTLFGMLVFLSYRNYIFYKKFEGYKKTQAIYIFLGLIIFILITSMMSFVAPVLGYPNLGKYDFFGQIFFIAITLYAIIDQNLMDIDLAWRYSIKNFIYFALLVFSITGVIYGNFNNNISLVIISVVAIILFAYLKPKIDTVLYNFFLGKYKKVWDEVKKAGEIKSDMYDKSGIINIIVLEIPKALNLTYSAYYELSESENKYFISTTTNANYYDGTIKELFFDHKLIQELYRTKSFLYLHALIKDEKNSEMSEVLKELKIDLCFPIFEKDLLLGVLVYGEKENSRFFNNEDLQILNSIIKDAEYQISNVFKVKHISETVSNDVLNKYKKTYQAQLLEESKRLGEIRNIKHFTEHSVKLVNRLLHTTQTNIYLYDEANNLYFNSNDKDCEQIAGSDYLIKYITEAKEIIFVEAFEKAVKEIKIKELVSAVETVKKMKASLIIPLMDFSRVLGFVTICNENNIDRKYSDDDLVLLGFVCDKIQTTLSNIYANEKANVDMLTSLHNRRYMMYRLESEVIRSYQEGLPLSFIMLDVDDFKFFNDAGGHHEGDLVLAQVADALQKLIRPTDECFRYGGDEFSIVFPDTDNEGVTSLANRLKLEFAEHENNEKLNEIFDTKVTLSIGASTYHPKNNNREYSLPEIHAIANFLIEKADTVLYDSKYEGKDRVSVSQPFSKVTYHIDLNKKEPEPIPREIDTLQYE